MEGGSDTDLEALDSSVSQKLPAKICGGEEEKMATDGDGGKAPEESPALQGANGSSRDTSSKKRRKKRDRTTYSEDDEDSRSSSSESEAEQQKDKEEQKELASVKDNVPSEGVCAQWGVA